MTLSNARSARPCIKRHPLPRRLGLQKFLDRPFHVLADVNTEGLYVEVNTLAAPFFVCLLKGTSHVWHLREQRICSLRHLATPTDVRVRVNVATVLQTPAAELARARAAADGKAAFKVEEGPPTARPRTLHLQDLLFNVLAGYEHLTPMLIHGR